jgi:hypothetical protein
MTTSQVIPVAEKKNASNLKSAVPRLLLKER